MRHWKIPKYIESEFDTNLLSSWGLCSFQVAVNDARYSDLGLVQIIILYLQSIIFIRDKNPRGQEVSGYIDYAHRLKTEEFEPYFSGKKRLIPRPSDLR